MLRNLLLVLMVCALPLSGRPSETPRAAGTFSWEGQAINARDAAATLSSDGALVTVYLTGFAMTQAERTAGFGPGDKRARLELLIAYTQGKTHTTVVFYRGGESVGQFDQVPAKAKLTGKNKVGALLTGHMTGDSNVDDPGLKQRGLWDVQFNVPVTAD